MPLVGVAPHKCYIVDEQSISALVPLLPALTGLSCSQNFANKHLLFTPVLVEVSPQTRVTLLLGVMGGLGRDL